MHEYGGKTDIAGASPHKMMNYFFFLNVSVVALIPLVCESLYADPPPLESLSPFGFLASLLPFIWPFAIKLLLHEFGTPDYSVPRSLQTKFVRAAAFMPRSPGSQRRCITI